MTLLRLITGPFGAPRCNGDVNEQNGNVLEERRRDEEDLIDTVLEIVFRVMWKGVEGFGESDWRVILVTETNLIARLALLSGLSLSFNSPVALIFTIVANLLLYG